MLWGGEGRGLWLQFLCFVKGKMILTNYYHCYFVLFAYMDVCTDVVCAVTE